ncbi:MAG TPA: DUF72 domain-containing protein, partial [Thermoanaerobaculia bacterium]|nr:DUF72 domain-containing protein [Thermoanaerobaculia bacterium]
GARRGPLLFQLPPWLKKDLPLLRDFLDALPAGVAAALEVRSDSWHDAAVYQALAERGVALAVVDDEKQGEPPLVATAPFGYARLRRPGYDDAELRGWAQRFAAQPWQEVHVFFKHEDAGAGPVLARRFLALAGEPSGEPRAPAAG